MIKSVITARQVLGEGPRRGSWRSPSIVVCAVLVDELPEALNGRLPGREGHRRCSLDSDGAVFLRDDVGTAVDDVREELRLVRSEGLPKELFLLFESRFVGHAVRLSRLGVGLRISREFREAYLPPVLGTAGAGLWSPVRRELALESAEEFLSLLSFVAVEGTSERLDVVGLLREELAEELTVEVESVSLERRGERQVGEGGQDLSAGAGRELPLRGAGSNALDELAAMGTVERVALRLERVGRTKVAKCAVNPVGVQRVSLLRVLNLVSRRAPCDETSRR